MILSCMYKSCIVHLRMLALLFVLPLFPQISHAAENTNFYSNMWSIVIPLDANVIINFAASELADALKRNGLEIAVNQSDLKVGQNVLHLFLSTHASDSALSAKEKDSFTIYTSETNIFIEGNSGRALLYGVYELLHLNGISTPIPNFSWLPKQLVNTPSKLQGLRAPRQKKYAPALSYRGGLITFSFRGLNNISPEDSLAIVDWMAKNRMNTVGFHRRTYAEMRKSAKFKEFWRAVAERGLDITVEGHSAEEIRSRGSLIGDVSTFSREHTEVGNIGLWGKDNTDWGNVFWQDRAWGNLSDKQLRLYADIVKNLNDNIQQKFIFLAYQDFISAPVAKLDFSFRDSLIVYFSPIARSYKNPLPRSNISADKKAVRRAYDWIEKGFADSLVLYGYYRKHNWNCLPVNTPELIKNELAWWHDRGCTGGWNYLVSDDWLAYDLQHYAYARFLWDTQTSLSDVISDFFTGVTGLSHSDAAVFIKAHEEMENIIRKISGSGYFCFSIKGLGSSSHDAVKSKIVILDDAISSFEAIDERMRGLAAKHPKAAKLCEVRSWWAEHWILKLKAAQKYVAGGSQVRLLTNSEQLRDYINFLASPPHKGIVRAEIVKMGQNILAQWNKSKSLPAGMSPEKL